MKLMVLPRKKSAAVCAGLGPTKPMHKAKIAAAQRRATRPLTRYRTGEPSFMANNTIDAISPATQARLAAQAPNSVLSSLPHASFRTRTFREDFMRFGYLAVAACIATLGPLP